MWLLAVHFLGDGVSVDDDGESLPHSRICSGPRTKSRLSARVKWRSFVERGIGFWRSHRRPIFHLRNKDRILLPSQFYRSQKNVSCSLLVEEREGV